MNKRNLTKGTLAGFLMVSMVFTGCQFGPAGDNNSTDSKDNKGTNNEMTMKSPEEVVKGMQATWGEEMSKIGSIDGSVAMMVEAEGTTMDLNVDLDGSYDMSDLTTPMLDMEFKLNGSAEQEGTALGQGDIELGMKVLADAMYLNLSKFDLQSDEPQVAQATAMVSAFVGSWFELPADAFAEFQASFPGAMNMSDADKEMQDKVMAVAKDASLFNVTEDKGMDNGAYHYAYEVDKDGFKQFLIDVAEASGESAPSEDELAQFDEGFEKLTISGEMWISADDMNLDRIMINLMGTDDDGVKVDVTVDMAYEQLESVTIEAPADAQPFPL